MSVLAEPQVTPDAVFALLRFLAARPDVAAMAKPIEEVTRWMTLGMRAQPGAPKLSERVEVVRSGAEALGFLRPGSCAPAKTLPDDWTTFCDELHSGFVQAPEQREVLDAYASLVVLMEDQEELGFLNNPVGILSNHLLRDDGQGQTANMNPTKWTPWRRWMVALGLGLPGPRAIADFLPHPAARLERVISATSELAEGSELLAEPFLKAIGRAMPYLDRGERARVAWKRAQRSPENRPLSHVLSAGLRDLHRRGFIDLRYAGGDRTGVVRLSEGSGDPESFASVRICGRAT